MLRQPFAYAEARRELDADRKKVNFVESIIPGLDCIGGFSMECVDSTLKPFFRAVGEGGGVFKRGEGTAGGGEGGGGGGGVATQPSAMTTHVCFNENSFLQSWRIRPRVACRVTKFWVPKLFRNGEKGRVLCHKTPTLLPRPNPNPNP